MLNRPIFSQQLSKEEFLQHYWYKTDLLKICSEYNLPTLGTKAELQKYILAFLDGNEPKSIRKQSNNRRLKTYRKSISLETKLIEDGFKFDNNARDFFAQYYNVSKFSFTKAMATALRKAEQENDLQMTVKDLIDIYENKDSRLTLKEEEESSYQWNNFLKDFYADGNTKDLNNRHQIVTFLWRCVRDTPGNKNYLPELLNRYADEIKKIGGDA